MGIALAGVGSFITFGVATGVTAAVIGGAVIGAAIGGLTAALTDGDIGKGMLFGAIGGAVVGGVSGMAAGVGAAGSEAVAGTTSAYSAAGDAWMGGMAAESGIGASGISAAEGIGGGAGLAQGAGAVTSASMLEGVGMQVGLGALSTGVKSWLGGSGAEDAAAAKSEETEKYFANQLQLSKEKGEQTMQQLQYTKENASAAETMALDARMSELGQRKAEFDQSIGLQRDQFKFQEEAKAGRQALFSDSTRRGGDIENTYQESGIYDMLQEKPQSALAKPQEELA